MKPTTLGRFLVFYISMCYGYMIISYFAAFNTTLKLIDSEVLFYSFNNFHIQYLIKFLLKSKNILTVDALVLDLIHNLTDEEDAETSDLAVFC